MQSFVVACFTLETRCVLPDDLANQLMNLLSSDGFNAPNATITTTVESTSAQPVGADTVVIELLSPDGTTNEEITDWVTDCIESLVVPTSPPLEVLSIGVF